MSALQSGLGRIKRDWSSNDERPTSSSQSSSSAQTRQLFIKPRSAASCSAEDRARRLRKIQEALDADGLVLVDSKDTNLGVNQDSGRKPPSLSRKRPSAGGMDESVSKKSRVLPDSFVALEPVSLMSGASSSRSSSSTRSPAPVIMDVRKDKARPAAAKPAKIFLSQEQLHILKLVDEGKSVFYTGSAGTGKSVLLREIIKALQKKYRKIPEAVAITASTGIASCNIGGVTVHSFAGIGLGVESAEQLAVKVKRNKKASSRWLRTRVLIIDEVSMVDGDLFDKLSRLGSILRKKQEPFGGIQLVVTGDFFQLPPVMKGAQAKFAFEAETWGDTLKHTFNLTKVFRQKDQEFVDMLTEMRFGRLTTKSIQRFRSLSRPIDYGDDVAPTELFPRREDVDRSNTGRMTLLESNEQIYTANDGGGSADPNTKEKLLGNFMAPKSITLKIGAQVMLIKNVDETLVNGTIGVVQGFVDPTMYKDEITGVHSEDKDKDKTKKKPSNGMVYPIVAFKCPGYTKDVMVTPEAFKVELPNGELVAQRQQLPLILAWAMSIHKSQGQTLDRVKVDLGKVFEKGQAYVALSRATSLEGLQVLNFDASKVNAHPKVVEWSKTLEVVTIPQQQEEDDM